jgi:hypothetical protein
MALVALLYVLGVMPLGKHGWTLIALIVLIGAIVLGCVAEAFPGRYRQNKS